LLILFPTESASSSSDDNWNNGGGILAPPILQQVSKQIKTNAIGGIGHSLTKKHRETKSFKIGTFYGLRRGL
jgi:hypothetical protein